MGVERVFVGRARELEQLGDLLDGVTAGRGALALIAGEAGIGKTRLASRVAGAAEQRGFRVAWGRCWEAGGAPAYFPWTQVFAALGIRDPFVSSDSTAGDASDLRFRRHDAAASSLTAAATDAPIAIVLDDLHAADLPSLDFLQALARAIGRARLFVVGTYREVEARVGDTGPLLAKIGREGDVLALPRLSREEMLAWIRVIAPETTDDQAARVCDATGGNPLFVHEVLRIRGQLDVRLLPSGLAAAIAEHLARIPETVRGTLAAASVLGRELATNDIAAVTDLDVDRAAADLRIACDGGIVEPIPERAEYYQFTHALVRDQLYAQLPPSKRAALHWRAGELATDPTLAAHHLLAGCRAGDVVRAAEAARAAAQGAIAKLAFEDASRLATQALEILGDDRSALACRLQLVQAEALIILSEGDRGRASCVQAAGMARSLGDAELIARAGLVYGTTVVSAQVDPVMVQLLRDGLAALEDSPDDNLRALVMSRLGTALTPPTAETYDETLRLARAASAVAQRTGDPRTQLRVALDGLNAHYYRETAEERDARVDRAVELATTLDDEFVLFRIAPLRFANLRERGRADDADRVLAEFEQRVRTIGRPRFEWRLLMLHARRATLAGDFVLAGKLGYDALAIAQGCDVVLGGIAWAQHRATLAVASGEPASIADEADRVIGYCRHVPGFGGFNAWVYAASGRIDEARAALSIDMIHRAHVPSTLFGAEAAMLLGDRDLVARAHDVLVELAWRSGLFWGGPPLGTALGPFARIAADTAAYLGRVDEARALYAHAIAVAERAGAAPLVALARRGVDAIGRPAAARAPVVDSRATLSHAGDHWTLTFEGRTRVLKARRGLGHLARLLGEPRRELHVLELSGELDARERGAPVLDAKAKAAYRDRLVDLREIAEGPDAVRAARAREEIDAIAHELSRALGIGGRDRTTTTAADRARAAVTLAIRRAIEAIGEHEPALAGHLDAAIRTGAFCTYRPDPSATVTWTVEVTM